MKRPRHYRSKAIVVALALALPLTGCGKSPEQHFKQAQELLQKSDYKAAVIELKTVLQAQPDNRDARLLLGEVYIKKEAYPDAESELSKARSAGMPDERVLPTLAKVYVRMGDKNVGDLVHFRGCKHAYFAEIELDRTPLPEYPDKEKRVFKHVLRQLEMEGRLH